jgi:hypothetical protein
MTFNDLVFDKPSVFGGVFYALAFFDNGIGVHVHTSLIREDLYEVSVVKGSPDYWVAATSINSELGIRDFPMNEEEVTQVMTQVARLTQVANL